MLRLRNSSNMTEICLTDANHLKHVHYEFQQFFLDLYSYRYLTMS